MAQAAVQHLPRPGDSTPAYPRIVNVGRPPARSRPARVVANGVLGMAIFLATETMIFAAFISAFLILRAGSTSWPPVGQPRLPVAVTAVNTLVLLFSAWCLWRASSADRQRDRGETIRWMSATAVLGVTFLVVQGTEWVRLLSYGLRMSSSLYGATFYTLIGCHAVHVLAGVGVLLWVLLQSARATSEHDRARLEVCQLYWFFVVAVWPILYVLVYLT